MPSNMIEYRESSIFEGAVEKEELLVSRVNRARPMRYNYIIVIFVFIFAIAAATVISYPIQIIASLVSTCFQAIIFIVAVNVFRFMVWKDKSNRPRVRTGKRSSVWVTGLMSNILSLILMLAIFVILFYIPTYTTPLLTQYLIDVGQLMGIPVLGIAMFSAFILIFQLFTPVQRR